MKTLRQKGYSLVEVVIVVAILSVIAVTGYRCLMYLTKEATQTSRAVTNPQRAQYDRFVGVLNDRLGQTWAFTAETASLPGINGNLIRLYNADGQEFADFGIYTDGTVYQYEIADAGGPAPLDFTYAFTNQDSTWDYSLQLTTNATIPSLDVTASWKVPPPLYLPRRHCGLPRPVHQRRRRGFGATGVSAPDQQDGFAPARPSGIQLQPAPRGLSLE